MTIKPWEEAAKENGGGYMNHPYYMGQELAESRTELRRKAGRIQQLEAAHKCNCETIECQQAEIVGLKGEAGVLCDLLRECLSVMDTIDGADLVESDRLGDLHEKICAAIEFKG